MADEETGTQEQVEVAAPAETAQAEVAQEDWESKYKASQAEIQESKEKIQEYADFFETVRPAIDFSKLNQPQESDDDEKKEVTQEDLQKFAISVDNKLLMADFRTKHPDLREYEDILIAPEVIRLRRSNPRMSNDKLLEKAAENAKRLLETERNKGREEAAKAKSAAASTGGMGAAGTSSTKKKEAEEKKGETTQEYVARRQKESARARGFNI